MAMIHDGRNPQNALFKHIQTVTSANEKSRCGIGRRDFFDGDFSYSGRSMS
jgi:hypothetical protein